MKSIKKTQFIYKFIEYRKRYLPFFEEKINSSLIKYTKEVYNDFNKDKQSYIFRKKVTNDLIREQMSLENYEVINILKNNLLLNNEFNSLNYSLALHPFIITRDSNLKQIPSIFSKIVYICSIFKQPDIYSQINEHFKLIYTYLNNYNYLKLEKLNHENEQNKAMLLSISEYKEGLNYDNKFITIKNKYDDIKSFNTLKRMPKTLILIEYLLIKTNKIGDYLVNKTANQSKRVKKFKEIYETSSDPIRTKNKYNLQTFNDFEMLLKEKVVLEKAILFVYQNLENEKENINKEFLEYLLDQYNVE